MLEDGFNLYAVFIGYHHKVNMLENILTKLGDELKDYHHGKGGFQYTFLNTDVLIQPTRVMGFFEIYADEHLIGSATIENDYTVSFKEY